MPAPDATLVSQIAAYSMAVLMGGAAAFERMRNAKQAQKRDENAEAISDAKKHQERANAMAGLAEEWKKLFEQTHSELNAYRDYVHEKQQKDQLLLSASQERIQELQARPDFSDLFDHLKTQSDVSVQILAGMKEVLTSIKTLVERSEPRH